MKKIIYSMGIFAVAAFAFSACQKEQSVKDELPGKKLVTVSFTAEKAGLSTKTAAVESSEGVSYNWTSEDVNNIKLFIVGTTLNEKDEEVETLTEVANPTVTKTSETLLTISGEVAPNATYKFRAILCDPASYTGSGTNYSTRKPKVKVKQNPNGLLNFDPTADILVSEDKEVAVGSSTEETISTSPLELRFRRHVVINKMTLKNLIAGEKVSKVVVTSTTGDIQGYLNAGTMSGQSKVITLEYNNAVVPNGGEFPVYFVSMPNDGIALTVEVTTDQNTYSKSFASGKTIDLVLGKFTKFSVVLPAGTPISAVPDGNYFITGVNSNQVYAAKMYVSGNNLSNPLAIDVDEDNEVIDYVNDIEDCIFTFTRITEGTFEGNYTIQDANGKYLYAAGGTSNNYLKVESAPDTDGNACWSVSKNNDGTYAIEAQGNSTHNVMRFNYNNGSPVFSSYGSGQSPITLYPASWCTIDTTPHITIDNTETSKTVLSAATSVVFNYTKNRYASDPTVSVASDPDGIVNGDPVVADGTITVSLKPNTEDQEKTATLSVSGTGLASAVTLTITQEAYQNLVNGNETFDLTKKTYTTTDNSVTWDGTSVAITNSSASGGTNATNYLGGDSNNRTSSRFYNNNTLTITPKSGYTITSVVFTATSAAYASALNGSTWTNATASVSSSTVTVTPTDGTAAITATIGGTCGFTSIVVNYLTAGSGSGSGSGSNSYTLDSDAITSAHSSAWNYTSGTKNITATDGSTWVAFNTFANANQVTLQMNKDKGCYVLTPAVTGKITKLTIDLAYNSDGTGTGTRGLDISDVNGTSIGSATAAELISGYSISGTHTQLKIEDSAGAVYIKSITINYE